MTKIIWSVIGVFLGLITVIFSIYDIIINKNEIMLLGVIGGIGLSMFSLKEIAYMRIYHKEKEVKNNENN